jgi:lysyl-tRNA synthetase class 2
VASKNAGWGEKLYALFEHGVESQLHNPTFITEFPLAVSPLSKKNEQNPELTDRFELFVAGMELANGFNELNDPDDQAQRFKDQVDARASGDAEAHHYDADFIKALEYGLPPTVGAGIGIDRLTMLLTNTTSIKDVILFPTLRPEK